VFGVLTRGVADAALLYDLLAEAPVPAGTAPRWVRSLQEAAAAGPDRLRIGVAFRLGPRARVAPDVQVAVAGGGDVLRQLGHSVSVVKVDPGSWLVPLTRVGLRVLVGDAQWLEARKRLEPRTQTALRTGSFINERVLRWAIGRQRVIAARTSRVFDTVDLVVTPTMTLPPVEAGKWWGQGAVRTSRGVGRWCPYTSLWNFVGQPAASIPAGFTDSGPPIGAQLLAPPDGEPTLIAVASQLENELGWVRARPPL